MASLVGLIVAGSEMFCGVSLKSASVAVGLSVKLNVIVGEWEVKEILKIVEEILKIGNY